MKRRVRGSTALRVLATFIALVGTAGVVVVGLATLAPAEDRTSFTPPGVIRSVDIEVVRGRVSVVAGATTDVVIDRMRRFLSDAPAADETVVDGVLRIRAGCPRVVVVVCQVDYRVEVPAGLPVRIQTTRGPVDVGELTGMVEIETVSGAVRLNGTKGPVKVDTKTGDVLGMNLTPDYLDATTTTGAVRLALTVAPGRVGLRTTTGSIDLSLPQVDDGYRTDVGSESGPIEVGITSNPGSNRSVAADSASGSIRIALG